MSVTKVKTAKGTVRWEVRWRDGVTNRKRTFDRKTDADEFEAHVKRAKQRGALGSLVHHKMTLDDLAKEWFRESVIPNLATATQKNYSGAYHRHVQPFFGQAKLAEINVRRINTFKNELLDKVGPQTVHLALTVLQSILQRGVEWGYIEINPARSVSKRLGITPKRITPIGPVGIEAMRQFVLARDRQPYDNLRDATFFSVLGYAGLRPSEALALTWGKIGHNTILIDCAASFGMSKSTKTGRTRSVDLVKQLKKDLTEFRIVCGSPADDELIFPSGKGRLYTEDDYRNWRNRVFKPAADAAGLLRVVPYGLRHGFVSLLIQSGLNVAEVAAQAGNSPDVTLKTYAHVIAEMKGMPPQPIEDSIEQARLRSDVPDLYLCEDFDQTGNPQKPLGKAKPTCGLEPQTPSLRVKCSTN